MENLTNVPDIDKLILLNLDDKSLSKAALVSTYINSLLDESFWASRFQQVYGVTLWKYGFSHELVYKEFSKLYGDDLIKRMIDRDLIELIKPLIEDGDMDEIFKYATLKNNTRVIKLLFDNGIMLYDVYPVMLFAIKNNNTDIVKLLLATDDDSVYNDEFLLLAIKKGYLDIIKLLINHGLNLDSDEYNLLEIAVKGGQLDLISFLLDKGVDIHADNDLALQTAAMSGQIEIVKLLIDRGANVYIDENYDEYIIETALYGHVDVMEVLLDHNINISEHIISIIVRSRNFKIIQLLVEKGVDKDLILREVIIDGNLEVLKLLMNDKEEINKDKTLLLAAKKGHIEIVNLLLESVSTETLNTALRLASENGHSKVVKLLIDNEVDSNIDLLQIAAVNGHSKVVDVLLEKNIDISGIEDEMLLVATKYNHVPLVKLILEKVFLNI